ncbi:unnamed protein product, partial [Thlaspi arvense]
MIGAAHRRLLSLSTRTLHRGVKQSHTSQNESLVLGSCSEAEQRNKENNSLPGKWTNIQGSSETHCDNCCSLYISLSMKKSVQSKENEKKKSETISSSSSNVRPLNDGREIKKYKKPS